MPAVEPFTIEVRHGGAFELLIGLYAVGEPATTASPWAPRLRDCPARVRRAIAAVGSEPSELWLHLLGIALELADPTPEALLEAVRATPARELRRHVLGAYVPAWRAAVGPETIERAARGDQRAARALLADDRYYAGRARDALQLMLPLSSSETKKRLVTALQTFLDEVFLPIEERVLAELAQAGALVEELARTHRSSAAIYTATGGYRYEVENEFPRVALIPQLAAAPLLLLCQHDDARVICHPAPRPSVPTEDALVERVALVGKALADQHRVRMLRRLRETSASLGDLADYTGLAKSTVHHHVVQLRAAGLVELQGNARAYVYALRRDALPEVRALLAEAVGQGAQRAPR